MVLAARFALVLTVGLLTSRLAPSKVQPKVQVVPAAPVVSLAPECTETFKETLTRYHNHVQGPLSRTNLKALQEFKDQNCASGTSKPTVEEELKETELNNLKEIKACEGTDPNKSCSPNPETLRNIERLVPSAH